PPWVVDEVDPDPRRDDDRRDHDVAEELPAGAEVERVVQQTDGQPEERGDRREREPRRPDLLGDEERVAVEPVDGPEEEDREAERDRDPETADPRDRLGVPAATARHVQEP